MPIEERRRCRRCGRKEILGEGLCVECWDKQVDSRRNYLKTTKKRRQRYYKVEEGKLFPVSLKEFQKILVQIGYGLPEELNINWKL